METEMEVADAVVDRMRAEFSEMPGLRLTPAQAGRLLGLAPEVCQAALDTLVAAAFLRWTRGGCIARAELV
jgi:hypothetical protein